MKIQTSGEVVSGNSPPGLARPERICVELMPKKKTSCSYSPPRFCPRGAAPEAQSSKLNYPETFALISAAVMEDVYDGKTVAKLISQHHTILTRANVMDRISELIPDIPTEAAFPDGTKPVMVHQPIV